MSEPLILTITDAGRAALLDAEAGGTAAVVIAEVGLAANDFVDAPTLTAVPGEFKRIGSVAGLPINDTTIHLMARDTSADVYSVRGFGLYLDTGALFAVYSQPALIFQKAGATMFLLALDVVLQAGQAELIEFGDVQLTFPPATETVQGVARIAPQAKVDAGTDDADFVTPLKLAARLANLLALYIPLAQRAAANGVATLGADGKIPTAQLPALAITETFVIGSQAAQLALAAQLGDVAVRTDLSKSFILGAEPANVLANWIEILNPGAPVQSVNAQVGNVNLTAAQVGAAAAVRQILSAGLASGGGDLSADRTINVPKASVADAHAGTSDVAALTPLGLWSFPGSNGANGYAQIPGTSLILQWGSVNVPADNLATVTFPLAFPSTCYQVLISPNGDTDDGDSSEERAWVGSRNTAQFLLMTGGSHLAVNYSWWAIGR
jgi:hypothetical protein